MEDSIMLKIAICDDDEISLSFIKQTLHSYSKETKTNILVDTFQQGEDLLKSNLEKHYHILILDIMMPNMDGIELAKELRKQEEDSFLIFLTSSDEYTKDAYQVDAIHYLMKPVKPEKLLSVIGKLKLYLPQLDEKPILVPTKDGLIRLVKDHIVYVEHINHVIYFHTNDGATVTSLTSSLTLSEVAEQLTIYENFFQPHRAYIVNMDYISSISKTDLLLTNEKMIPIPSRRSVEIRRQYTSYCKALR